MRHGSRSPRARPRRASRRGLTTKRYRTASTRCERGRPTAPATSAPRIARHQGRSLSETCRCASNTRLVAGQIKIVKGRRTRGGRRRTRRVIVVRPKVPFGGTIPIRGRLTMPGENAIADAGIEVWERLWIRGAVPRRVAVIGTDGSGRFAFKALAGPSRTLAFPLSGHRRSSALGATEVDIRVTGCVDASRVNRRRVVNGEDIVLRGRVRGGPLPTVGKLVQLQAYSRGRWLTFATPRARQGDGSLVVSLPVHVDPRHGALSIPSTDPAGSRVPVHRRTSRDSVRVVVRGL